MGKHTILVIGATGAQGGSLIRSLLKSKDHWIIKGTTRNTDSDASKKLEKEGVVMVKCDLNNKSDILNAFKGVDIVFANTNFWDPSIVAGDQTLEEKQGFAIADAAIEARIKHLVYSSLANCTAVSKGKYDKVVHFDGKARVEDYIKSKKIPATFVQAAFYFSNMQGFFPPFLNAEGVVTWSTCIGADTKVPMIDIPTDFGTVVHHVIKNLDKFHGQTIPITSGYFTMNEMVSEFTKVTGKKAVYHQITRDQHKTGLTPFVGEQAAEELIQMNEYFNDFGYFENRDLDAFAHLVPDYKMVDWNQYFKMSGYTGPN